MSQRQLDFAKSLLRRNQTRIERQTVHHSRFDARLHNWHELYFYIGHCPRRDYSKPPARLPTAA